MSQTLLFLFFMLRSNILIVVYSIAIPFRYQTFVVWHFVMLRVNQIEVNSVANFGNLETHYIVPNGRQTIMWKANRNRYVKIKH